MTTERNAAEARVLAALDDLHSMYSKDAVEMCDCASPPNPASEAHGHKPECKFAQIMRGEYVP